MDPILQFLLALVTLVNSATGGEIEATHLPDRPAIVAPTMAATSFPQPSLAHIVEINGTVQSIQGGTLVVDGQQILMGPQVRILGDLRVGVRAYVRAEEQVGETPRAREIRVESGKPISEPEAAETVQAKPSPKPTEKSESKSSSTSSATSSSSSSGSSKSSSSVSASSSSASSSSSSSSISSSSESSKSSSSASSSSSSSGGGSGSSSSESKGGSESSKSSSTSESRTSSESSRSSSSSSSR